jgi:glycosyltransferase involved in cell wall biosynthesis
MSRPEIPPLPRVTGRPEIPAAPTVTGRPEIPPVLHVDAGRGWRGGQAQVFELLRGLRGMGVRQALATPPRSALGRKAGSAGIAVLEIPMRGEWDLLAPRRIAREARRIGARLLHAHDSRAHGLCWRALPSLPEARLVVTRRVDFPVGGNWLSRRKYGAARTHYIAISTGVRDALTARGAVRPDRVDIVPSGIDPRRFRDGCRRDGLKRELGLAPGAVVIGQIAALADHKGQRYLIDAAKLVAAAHPESRFVIVGEGELRGALERQIAATGLTGTVHLAGFREDIETFLAGFDLFVLSSHMEGLGTSLLDAMWFGIPIVATRVGGVPDVIEDGVNGLLVAPRDPAALAQATLRLLADAGLRRRLGEEGRRTVEERFTAARMVEGTAAVYRGLERASAVGRS